MSLLTDKRQEFMNKLTELETSRSAKIEAAVKVYRQQLELETPTTDIDQIKHVISALDEVIAYDIPATVDTKVETTTQVHNMASTVVSETVEPTITVTTEARPGMTEIFTPQR